MDVLACHQTPDYNAWYRGSADAVRRNLPVILEQYRGAGIPEELLILSGQAIYRMVGKVTVRQLEQLLGRARKCHQSFLQIFDLISFAVQRLLEVTGGMLWLEVAEYSNACRTMWIC